MKIAAGAMITDAMERQRSKDFIRIVIEEFVSTGFRIQAKLDTKAAQDPAWADVAQYHRGMMEEMLGEPWPNQ